MVEKDKYHSGQEGSLTEEEISQFNEEFHNSMCITNVEYIQLRNQGINELIHNLYEDITSAEGKRHKRIVRNMKRPIKIKLN